MKQCSLDETFKVTMIARRIYEVSNHIKLWCTIGYTWQRISDARLFAILTEYQKTDRWGGYLPLHLLWIYCFGSAILLGFVTFPPLRSFNKDKKKKLRNEKVAKSRREATRRMLSMKGTNKISFSFLFGFIDNFGIFIYTLPGYKYRCFGRDSITQLKEIRQHNSQ